MARLSPIPIFHPDQAQEICRRVARARIVACKLAMPLKFPEFAEVEPGERFFVSWERCIKANYRNTVRASAGLRSLAHYWGKRLNAKFSTKRVADGIWVARVE